MNLKITYSNKSYNVNNNITNNNNYYYNKKIIMYK